MHAHMHVVRNKIVRISSSKSKTDNQISNTTSQNNALLWIPIALSFDQHLDDTYHCRWHILRSPPWCCCCEIPQQFWRLAVAKLTRKLHPHNNIFLLTTNTKCFFQRCVLWVLLVDTSATYIHLGALRQLSREAHTHVGTAQEDFTH